MQRGIKVVSWDSGVAKAGRQIHLNPSNNALIGETNVKLAADALKALNVEKGEVAVLSATPTSTNQNTPDCGDEKGAAEVPVRQSGDRGLRRRSL